jgi:hypothetical protein
MPTKNIDGGLTEDDCNIAVGIDQSLTGFALSAVQIDDPSKHLHGFINLLISVLRD